MSHFSQRHSPKSRKRKNIVAGATEAQHHSLKIIMDDDDINKKPRVFHGGKPIYRKTKSVFGNQKQMRLTKYHHISNFQKFMISKSIRLCTCPSP